MRWMTMAILAVMFGSACRELPVAPEPGADGVRPDAAFTATPSGCDKFWTLAVSGSWNNASMWSPAGVPGLLDDVCFQGGGSYTVWVGADYSIADLTIEDGADVEFSGSGTITASRLTIERTGRLSLFESCLCNRLEVGSTTIEGSLDLGWTVEILLGDTQLNGLLEMYLSTIHLAGDLTFGSNGEVLVDNIFDNTIAVDPGRVVRMPGGRVSGMGAVIIDGGTFEWSGGSPSASRGGDAAVEVENGTLVLAHTALSGSIGARNATMIGHIGPDVTLELTGVVELQPPASGAPSDPVQVAGTMHLAIPYDQATIRATAIVNTGTFLVEGYEAVLAFSSVTKIDNRGLIEVEDTLRLLHSTLENRGTIRVLDGGVLEVDHSDFVALPAGAQTGFMALGVNGRLWGTGSVGQVRAFSGSAISPGTTAGPLGTLTVDRLDLESGAQLIVDLVGLAPGQADHVRSNGDVHYGGMLEVRRLGAFLGGVCGQVIPILTFPDSATASGGFGTFAGVQSSPTRAWRAHYGPTELSLAGYDPTATRAGFSPAAVTLREGGAGRSVNVCLGRTAPTSDVSLAQTGGAAQAVMTPTSVSFTLADWMLPRSVVVSAIDDAIAEGPHAAVLAFQTTSTDPGYDQRQADSLTASITDNDAAADLTPSLVWTAPATINANQQFEARFRVTNNGPGASTGSTFTISPMTGIDYVSNTVGVTCAPAAGLLTCTVGPLAASAQTEFVIVFRALSAGVWTNTVTIAGADFDDVAANNAFAWSVTAN